ncbi:DUF2399 domain-containing protein [Streptomyces sp. NPDC052095]|uniref:DUF2399 domain-containing protein n=1 Tax=unclassified Streptomyces TaxID=2593676 RepID=UPI00344BB796
MPHSRGALRCGCPKASQAAKGRVRALTGFPDGSGAAWRREAWASAGLLRDEVSSTVLALALRGTPALDRMADTGEPAVLTLRSLVRREPATAVPEPGVVHVCGNPAVLSAAADLLGPACPPLVCLQGQPSAAAPTPLRGLGAHGAELRYHGDFDRDVARHPRRYGAADYRAAPAGVTEPQRLTGAPAATEWDPDLATALAGHGVRVEEEAVLDDLLADLARAAGLRVRADGGPVPAR